MHLLPEKTTLELGELAAKKLGVWALLYPRIYEGVPQDYCSPKFPAATMIDPLYMPLEKQPFTKPVVAKLIQYSMPMLWLDKGLAEAILQTTPPSTYDLLDLQLPLPTMTILLPKGTITTKDEGEVRYIAFAKYEGKELHGTLSSEHLFLFSVTENGVMQVMSLGRETSKIDLSNIEAFIRKLDTKLSTNDTDAPLDEDRNRMVLFYFVSIMLLMTTRKDLITEPKLLKRIPAHKGKEPREFWTPHFLGKGYRAARQEPNGGEHQSPRMHWVRGFWRNQPVGPRELQDHKLRWIEPFLRGV